MLDRKPIDAEQPRVLAVIREAAPAARHFISQHALKMNDPAFEAIDERLKQSHARDVTNARQSHEGADSAPGAVLEAIILRAHHEDAEFSGRGWLSSKTIHCRLVKTTEYDDFCGGVDFVMTFTKDDGTLLLAVAIDAAQGNRSQEAKLEKVIDSIRNEKPTSIAYFTDPTSGFSGQLKDVPMFLGVFDAAHVAEIETYRQENGDAALREHPAQITLLTELSEQARVFSEFARDTHGKSDNKLYERYSQAQRVLSQVLQEKLQEKQWPAWGGNDKACRGLLNNLSRLDQHSNTPTASTTGSRVVMAAGLHHKNPRPVLVERRKRPRFGPTTDTQGL